jgi:hypothetical protein
VKFIPNSKLIVMKNTFFLGLLPAALAVVIIAGCKKSASAPSPPAWTTGADVYFVGQDTGRVVYWKNGVRTVMGPGEGQGIAVSGSDVYVIGTVNQDTNLVWKDGQRLVNSYASAGKPYDQILVSGGNIYVVSYGGYEVNFTGYIQMPGVSQVSSMSFNGSDIFVAGARDSAGEGWAAYWMDGVMNALPNYAGTSHSVATGVVAAGSDVYVAGLAIVNGTYCGVYWRNGGEGTLTKNGLVNGVVVGG